MTSTRAHEIPDTVSGVLAGLRAEQQRLDQAEIRKLRLAVGWAMMHSAETIVGPVTEWSEHAIPLGGPGAPVVAEFCIAELAVTLGVSHDSATAYLCDAVELAYRLPRTYARVLVGELAVWKARRVAQATHGLPMAGATFVDAHVAHVAHSIGYAALGRLIEEAQVRFDPEAAELRRLDAAECRSFDILLREAGHDGTVEVAGTLDYADALDLETAVAAGAAELAALGNAEALDVRRSLAVGVLARDQLSLDLNVPGKKTVKARQVVLHVHLSDQAVARVEELGPAGGCLSVEQVGQWCTGPDTQVVITGVIDLNASPRTDSYEIPDRMREQVVLRDRHCVFPQCQRNARRCDLDHILAWHEGGVTTPPNLAPLCRRHHRLKTHGGWAYTRNDDGTYEWTSPHHRVSQPQPQPQPQPQSQTLTAPHPATLRGVVAKVMPDSCACREGVRTS